MATTSVHPNTGAFPAGVSQPAIRAFAEAGIVRYEELAGRSERELLAMHGVGPKAIRIIRQALIDAGLEPFRP